jgi:hypothetical protein
MSDPIQIAAAAFYEPQWGERFVVLYALCADGTIWRLESNNNQWKELPPIPPRRSAKP